MQKEYRKYFIRKRINEENFDKLTYFIWGIFILGAVSVAVYTYVENKDLELFIKSLKMYEVRN